MRCTFLGVALLFTIIFGPHEQYEAASHKEEEGGGVEGSNRAAQQPTPHTSDTRYHHCYMVTQDAKAHMEMQQKYKKKEEAR